MKQTVSTTLLIISFLISYGGIIHINWPYMDNTNNCIEVFNDPNNNSIQDIQLSVHLKSFSSYNNHAFMFDKQGTLGALVTTDYYTQFVALSEFVEESNGRFLPYSYSKNLSIPYAPSIDHTFDYEITLVYESENGGDFIDFTNTKRLFVDFESTTSGYDPEAAASNPVNVTTTGSASTQDIKNICVLQQRLASPIGTNIETAPKTINVNSIDIESHKLYTSIFPNPFLDEFTIQYQISKPQNVRIEVFDASGTMRYLHDKQYNQDSYQKTFNTTFLSKGVYYCRFVTENSQRTFKLIKAQ